MPTISDFFGIFISMYKINEHNPPHFHAFYGEYEAAFDFNGKVINGKFPPKQARFVRVWAQMRKEYLITNWARVMNGGEPLKIEPLR